MARPGVLPHRFVIPQEHFAGFQTLQWITMHPDFMDWAIPIAQAIPGARIFAYDSIFGHL